MPQTKPPFTLRQIDHVVLRIRDLKATRWNLGGCLHRFNDYLSLDAHARDAL